MIDLGNFSTSNVKIGGKPYQYTGNFRLVCRSQTTLYAQNSCYNASQCACILHQYMQCKYNPLAYRL